MTIEVSRRQLMASMGGMVLASFALPPALRKAIDNAPPSVLSSANKVAPISEIKHVVVLMQENRSFDHYFGAMPGVRGFGDTSVNKDVFYQKDTSNPKGYLLPWHADTTTTNAQQIPSNSHSWGPLHDSWDNGTNAGFVTAHLAADGPAGQYSMAYFNRDDIPFQWALADAFTVCDGYHASMLGPTWPNRLYLMTGQVNPGGGSGGPVTSNEVPTEGFSWETYPEMLSAAGVSWKVYQENDNYGMNVLEYFDQYHRSASSTRPPRRSPPPSPRRARPPRSRSPRTAPRPTWPPTTACTCSAPRPSPRPASRPASASRTASRLPPTARSTSPTPTATRSR